MAARESHADNKAASTVSRSPAPAALTGLVAWVLLAVVTVLLLCRSAWQDVKALLGLRPKREGPKRGSRPPPLRNLCVILPEDAHNAWDERTLEGLSRVLKWARSKGVQQVRVHDRHGSRVDDIERVSGGRAAVSTEASGLEHVCELIRSFPEARDAGRFPELVAKEHEADGIFVFGSTLSLRGLGPLYSRAAEIFWMGNLSRVTDAQLDRAAQMYDNVTQRMGT